MSVNSIVSGLYKNIAEIICHEECSENCTYKCTCSLNVRLKAVYNIEMLPELFYSALDNIAMELNSDTDIKRISYGEYYKDADVIKWDKLIAKIRKYAHIRILKCSHSNHSHNELVSETQNYISGIITRNLIAEMIYFKENHHVYEKILWKSYSEVIEKSVGNNGARLSKREYNKIRDIAQEITAEAVSSVYKSIYGKSTVKVPIPDISQFAASLKFNLVSYLDIDSDSKKVQPWYRECSYYSTIKDLISEESFISLAACYKMMTFPFSKNTYLELVKNYIPKLIGIDETIMQYLKRSANNGRYIHVNYADKFNQTVISAHEFFGKRGKSYKFDSRFQLIQSLDDLKCFYDITKTYLGIMSLFLEEEQYNALFDKNPVEVQVIMKAAENYFYLIQPKHD